MFWMTGSYGQCFFYSGFPGGKERRGQGGISPQVDFNEHSEHEEKRSANQVGGLSFLGIKLSYSKAFGIAFLIIFLLLFFPGIGVSSSSVQSKGKVADGENGNPKGNTSNNLFMGRR